MGSRLIGLFSYWKHIEQGIGAKFLLYTLCMYSQTCAQQPPLGPQKVAVVQRVAVVQGLFQNSR